MSEEIAFKITVDTNVGELSVGELKEGFKQLTQEINKTKAGTEAYKQNLVKLGEVKGALNDLKQGIIALDPEKRFRAFAQLGSTIASGFAAAQGAMAIFGSESEDLQKVLVRVQAAMALAQGLQGLAGFSKALTTARLAMIAFASANPFTVIAAAVVALGVAVYKAGQYFDWWGTEAKKAQKANEDLALSNEYLEGTYDELETALNNQIRLLKAQGKETYELEVAQKKQLISNLEAQIMNFNKMSEVTEEQQEQWIKLGNLRSQLINDLEVIQAEHHTKEIEDEKKKNEQIAKDQEKHFDDIEKQYDDNDKKRLKKEDEKKQRKKELDAIFLKDQEEQNTEALRLTKELKDEEADLLAAAWAQQEHFDNLYLEKLDEKTKKEKAQAEYIHNLKIQLQQQAITAISGLSNTFFENQLLNEKLTARQEYNIKKKQFQWNKAASAVQATLDTISAVQKNYAQGGLAVGSALNVAQIAIGAANVAAILAKKYPAFQEEGANIGGAPSPGGGSAPAIQSPQGSQFAATSTQVNTDQSGNFTGFGNGGNKMAQNIKAYVVETELTTTQKKIKSIEEKTTY